VGLQPETLLFLRHCSAETLSGVSFYLEAAHSQSTDMENSPSEALTRSAQLFADYIAPFGQTLRRLQLTFAGEKSHSLGQPFLDAISSALEQCNRITKLYVAADWNMLSHFASLMWLDDLTLDFTSMPRGQGLPDRLHPLEPFLVTSLTLCVTATGSRSSISCLNTRATRDLRLQIKGKVEQLETIYTMVTDVLFGDYSNNLVSFQLQGNLGPARISGLAGMEILQFSSFELLLDLHSLQVVVINTTRPVRTTNTDLQHLSKSWPALQTLNLSVLRGDNDDNDEVNQFFASSDNSEGVANLAGLLHLRACTQLQSLTMCMDGRTLPLVLPPSPASTPPPLARLSVGYSPLYSVGVDRTVEILAESFPSLELFCFSRLEDSTSDSGDASADDSEDGTETRRRPVDPDDRPWYYNSWKVVDLQLREARWSKKAA
jgi:hypothetical protein